MYAILRTKKLKNRSHLTAATEHNLRLRTQSNIDTERSQFNKVLVDTLHIDLRKASSFQQKLSEHYASLGVREKNNNVLAFEYVVTASPEFFTGRPDKVIQKWANDQVKFMQEEFGKQLKFAMLHMDEKSPHIHFFVSTEIQSVKQYKNRYGACEKKTWSLNSNRINPEFLVDLQTRFADMNKKWGLKRGVKGSLGRHSPTKNFYRFMDKVMKTSYANKVNEVIDNIQLSIGERLSMDTVRDKIRECLTPYIKGTLRERRLFREFAKLDFHKLQTELIADHEKIKEERAEISEVRGVYREAINGRLQDIQLTEYLLEQNSILAEDLRAMIEKYEPDRVSSGHAAMNLELKKP